MSVREEIPEVTLDFEDGLANDKPRFAQHAQAMWTPPSAEAAESTLLSPDELEHRLSTGPLPGGVLGVVLGVAAVFGLTLTTLGSTWGIAGVTIASEVAARGLATSIAAFGSVAFGTLRGIVIVLGVWTLIRLRVRGRSSRPIAFLVMMTMAWLVNGIMAALTLATTPFLTSSLAFVAALTTALALVVPRQFRPYVCAIGAALAIALAVSLVMVGAASVLGALASGVVGVVGVLLGAKVWNRWLAPVMDVRDRARILMAHTRVD